MTLFFKISQTNKKGTETKKVKSGQKGKFKDITNINNKYGKYNIPNKNITKKYKKQYYNNTINFQDRNKSKKAKINYNYNQSNSINNMNRNVGLNDEQRLLNWSMYLYIYFYGYK